MIRMVGDNVQVQPKEWLNNMCLGEHGAVCGPDGYYFLEPMFRFAGKKAVVTEVTSEGFRINLDRGRWIWTDWMVQKGAAQ
jgi:hypothetical protein